VPGKIQIFVVNNPHTQIPLFMRTSTALIFIAAAVLVGCHSPSKVGPQSAASAAATRPTFRPMLITTPGTNTTLDGVWRVSVSKTSLELSRSMSGQGEGWTSSGWDTTSWHNEDRPEWWTAHAGWFVFLESESRAWAYSGDRRLILLAYTRLSGTNASASIYESRFPCAVPTEVYARLSEPARKAIETHD